MRWPLVIVDDRVDVTLCDSPAHLRQAVEPEDVESGLLEAFDSEGLGMRLEIATDRPGRRILGLAFNARRFVTIAEDAAGEPRPGRLLALLKNVIRAKGVAEWDGERASLEELIAMCRKLP